MTTRFWTRALPAGLVLAMAGTVWIQALQPQNAAPPPAAQVPANQLPHVPPPPPAAQTQPGQQQRGAPAAQQNPVPPALANPNLAPRQAPGRSGGG